MTEARDNPSAPSDHPLNQALMALGDGLLQGVLVLEPGGQIRIANPVAREMFGWDRRPAAVLSIEAVPLPASLRARFTHDSGPWEEETTLEVAPSPIPVRIAARPLGRDGEAGSLVLITDLRELRTAIAERDLARQNDRAKTRSLHMVAHDLSGPITILNGYISMVLDGSLGVGALEPYLPILAEQLDYMQRLLQVLLDTARLEEGRVDLRMQPLDLGAFVETLVGGVRAPETGHQIMVQRDATPLEILADPVRLDSIIRNLISNATKYSAEGTTVTCTVRAAGAHATLEVADQGVGITSRDQARLFSRFGRVGDQATNPAGVGLGLFSSRELARLHGGDLVVESEPGRGSRFTLHLPLRRRPATSGGSWRAS